MTLLNNPWTFLARLGSRNSEMAHCQHCGAEAAPKAAVCTQCGTKLKHAAPIGSQTILGGLSPFAPSTDGSRGEPGPPHPASATSAQTSPTPTTSGARPLSGTMIGLPSPFAQEVAPGKPREQPSPPPASRALSGTMVGMPSPFAAGPAERTGANDPKPTPSRSTLSGTMVGMPSPFSTIDARADKQSLAATQQSHSPAPTISEPTPHSRSPLSETMKRGSLPQAMANDAPPGDGNPGQSPAKRFQGTLMGVAQPGIAPSHHRPEAPPAAFPTPAGPQPPGADSHPPSNFPASGSSRPIWQTALLVGLGLCAAASVGGVMALMGKPDLTMKVTRFAIDDAGKDQLELSCDGCPDGTTVRIGDAESQFQSNVSTIVIDKQLDLGENRFELQVTDPAGESLSAAPLTVPVAFRMSSNWTGRHALPPFGQVLVEAPPGSRIKIDGKPMDDTSGQVEYQVLVDEPTLGESTDIEKVALDIPIEVTTGDKTRQTRATLRGGITPLRMTSVGPILEFKSGPITLAGVSAPGATVRFGDLETTASDQGEFALVLTDPVEADSFVTAQAGEFLVRRIPLRLTQNMEAPVTPIEEYSALTTAGMARFKAMVIESRTSDGVTRSLLEVADGCTTPPCLISATYAMPHRLPLNRSILVTGWATPGDPVTVKVSHFQ